MAVAVAELIYFWLLRVCVVEEEEREEGEIDLDPLPPANVTKAMIAVTDVATPQASLTTSCGGSAWEPPRNSVSNLPVVRPSGLCRRAKSPCLG